MPPAYSHPDEERSRLARAALGALAVEVLFFLAMGLGHLPLFRNPFSKDQYADVQILQLPQDAHLTGAQASAADDEIVYNPHRRHPRKKTVKKAEPPKAPEQNQVKAGPVLPPTHGPVALYAPSPVIPEYLRNENLKTSVVIEFQISSQGEVTPRLLESSGSDELDAVALDTVKKWQFKPATKDNVPVDSKTRLRILFEVY